MRDRNARADLESSTTKARLADIGSPPGRNARRVCRKCRTNPDGLRTYHATRGKKNPGAGNVTAREGGGDAAYWFNAPIRYVLDTDLASEFVTRSPAPSRRPR